MEKLDSLMVDREQKIENIALWIKNLKADAEALKEEKNAFAERQKAAENKAESLKQYLTRYLNGETYKSPKVAVSFRRSEAVQINDIAAIEAFDDKYIKYSEPTADKTAIKAAIKAGINVPGAELIQSSNIQIK